MTNATRSGLGGIEDVLAGPSRSPAREEALPDGLATIRIALLFPGTPSTQELRREGESDRPVEDAIELRMFLCRFDGVQVDLLDYTHLARGRWLSTLRRLCGSNTALGLLAFSLRHRYQVFFSAGESIALPLALALRACRSRRRLVTIGHRLSAWKKRLLFKVFHLHDAIDAILVYTQAQYDFARSSLNVPGDRLRLINFHADHRFFRPPADEFDAPLQICSAGLERRDYATLLSAVERLPDVRVHIAANSYFSKSKLDFRNSKIPANVTFRHFSYEELRKAYESSFAIVIPLLQNDYGAGLTTMMEAMMMGKPLIVTETIGRSELLVDDVNCLMVPPLDEDRLRKAIVRTQADHALRERIGRNARRTAERYATTEIWARNIGTSVIPAMSGGYGPPTSR